MMELAISFCVVVVGGVVLDFSRRYFDDKKLAREASAKERDGLPVEVFSRLQDFEKRVRTIESQSFAKSR